MQSRHFIGAAIALSALFVPSLTTPTYAAYGVTSTVPLVDASKAAIDESVAGTWSAVINERTYYLHVGTGNIVGKFDWMELLVVNPGEQRPTFYVTHLIGYPATIDGKKYFQVAFTSQLVQQLRTTKIEQLLESVDRYEILRYERNGDFLDVWAADQKQIRAAIEAGEIAGREARIEDSSENLVRFLRTHPDLFATRFRYTRVKEPDPQPPEEPAERGAAADGATAAIEAEAGPTTRKPTARSK